MCLSVGTVAWVGLLMFDQVHHNGLTQVTGWHVVIQKKSRGSVHVSHEVA